MRDVRKVMEPFTAIRVKVRKQNTIKDFVSVSGFFNVTHILVFSKTTKNMYLRVCRTPRGPTLVFRIDNFSLAKDVLSKLRKPVVYAGIFLLPPLLILNGFPTDSSNQQVKLITSMFSNMFPSIDVQTVKLSKVRRTVVFNYNAENDTIEFRHYAISTRPVGLSRPVKKLLVSKKLPDLSKLKSIEDFFEKDLSCTESENDEADVSRHVVLPQHVPARGNLCDEKSAVRLTELGPRMTLKLIRIQEGLMKGKALYEGESGSFEITPSDRTEEE